MGMFKKRNQLSKLGLDEISLVPSGDDPSAEVVIAKADDELTNGGESESRTLTSTEQSGASMPDENDEMIDLTGVSPEVAAYIAALEDEIQRNDVVGEILDMIDTEVEQEPVLVGKSADEDPAEVLAKADPAIRAIVEKAQQDAAEAQAIAKAERDLREHREFVAKAEQLPMISENPEQLAEVLKGLHAADPALATTVEAIFAAANTQIAKGNLFAEFGSSVTPSLGDTEAGSKVDEILKADPSLTPEQAYVKALESNPDLYDPSL